MSSQTFVSAVRDRVIVKVITKDKTPGGIALPDNIRGIVEGEVVAVGGGTISGPGRVKCEVKTGDRIMFHVSTANEMDIDGEKLFCMKEYDILAVLRRQPAKE